MEAAAVLRWPRYAVCLALVLLSAGSAAAQQFVEVKIGPARVHERPLKGGDVVVTLQEGTRLQVISKEGDWYWVLLPREPSGTQRGGYIQSFLVEVIGGTALLREEPGREVHPAPPPRPAATGPTGRGSGAAGPARSFSEGRLLLHVDGGRQTTEAHFDDDLATTRYLEKAAVRTRNRVVGGTAMDIGASIRVSRQVLVGAELSWFRRDGTAGIEATVPHPFYFDHARSLKAAASALGHEVLGFHMQAAWQVSLPRRLDLLVFGGPSVFTLQQDLVSDLRLAEAYPFEAVHFDGAVTTRRSGRALGFNVGGDLAYGIWRQLGAGVRVRYASAAVEVRSADDDPLSVDVGGLQVLGGLRVRF